jgi:hypothetical protein
MQQALVQSSFPAANVFAMTGDAQGPDALTSNSVIKRLNSLAERVGPEDTFLFYFSGHGYQQTEGHFLAKAFPRICNWSPKALLFDKLPADVRQRVVWRENYRLTDEALSTYRRSAGLSGLEMHSPIMCIGNDIPAIVCRFAEQTSKGFMWRDIGLGGWLFDMDDEAEIKKIVPTVLTMAKDPIAARAKAATAREFVRRRQAETMAEVSKHVFAA